MARRLDALRYRIRLGLKAAGIFKAFTLAYCGIMDKETLKMFTPELITDREMKMKRLTTAFLLCLAASNAHAVKVTLIQPDEVEVSDGKLCVYKNAQRSESVKVAKSGPNHHTKTFDSN